MQIVRSEFINNFSSLTYMEGKVHIIAEVVVLIELSVPHERISGKSVGRYLHRHDCFSERI